MFAVFHDVRSAMSAFLSRSLSARDEPEQLSFSENEDDEYAPLDIAAIIAKKIQHENLIRVAMPGSEDFAVCKLSRRSSTFSIPCVRRRSNKLLSASVRSSRSTRRLQRPCILKILLQRG